MPKFVELWVYLSATPLFGLTATLAVYVLAQTLYTRLNQPAWANPVLWSVVVIASVLLATGVSYPTYFAGAQFIHFLLGPAVVALGWPLWKRRVELRQRWGRLLLAALAGGVAASASAVALGWLLGCQPTWCCRSRPNPSPHRWRWVLQRRLAAYRHWQPSLP